MLNLKIDNEWRSEERIQVSLKVNLLNMYCMTRDVSVSGVFLEVNAPFVNGRQIDFTVEFDNPGGKLLLICKGKILRVVKWNGRFGVAIRILKSEIQSAEKSLKSKISRGFSPVLV
jgi:hypothetical protein